MSGSDSQNSGAGGRVLVGELMDDPALDAREHLRALRGLARCNFLSAASKPIAGAAAKMLGAAGRMNGEVRVCDVACGSGDVLVALARRLVRMGYEPRMTGCDISSLALEQTVARCSRRGVAIEIHEGDVFESGIPEGHDIVVSSLFLHHLEDDRIAQLLGLMSDSCGVGVVVSDLERSRLGLSLAWCASRAVTRSRVVHVDAVRSARAALTRRELASLAARANMERADISRVFPARLLLGWERGS